MRKPDAVAQPWPGAVTVAVPFCLMALVVVADVLAGPQIGLLPLLSLGPALAPVSLGPARTTLTGVLAIVLSVLVASFDGIGFSLRAVVAVTTIVGVTAAGVLASAARQRGERELVNVRAVADVAQRVLLRQVPRRVGQVLIAMRYISAAAAARIGGDLYDVVALAGTARLIVADVQGKGLAAVQTAAVVLASFRESVYDAPDLGGIAEHIELSLEHQAPEGKFVTAIIAEVDREGTEIRLLNCGHPAPLLVSGGLARLAEPVEAALPLGLAGLAAGDRKEYTVPFGSGDRMLFYTDGISEARDKAGAFYPLDRCGALLGGPDPDAALGQLYDDVLGHVGGRLHDDSAALFVMRPPRSRRGNPSTSASPLSACPPASWSSLPTTSAAQYGTRDPSCRSRQPAGRAVRPGGTADQIYRSTIFLGRLVSPSRSRACIG
jgi:serine phosphatase RsbU (regulator of sigma subunit)